MQTNIKKLEKQIDIYEIFRILSSQEDFKDKKISFLDSSLTNKYGKFSIIAMNCFFELREEKGKTIINGVESERSFDEVLDKFLMENKEENTTNLPIIAGGIGYFSYDYGRKYENICTRHNDDLRIPESIIRFYRTFIIQNNETSEIYISYKVKEEYLDLLKLIENIEFKEEKLIKNTVLSKFYSHFSKGDYLNAIKRTIDYIIEGDVYITNLTQRLEIKSKKNPLSVFAYLRKFNPSPFGSYLDYGDFEVVSASPERFIRMENGIIKTRPIKGTRKRGSTLEEDEILKKELANSEKDKSELLMIVDLERNDLHRICELKSVKVEELFEVETYSTVFHLVSTIKGKLQEKYKFVDLLRATFPGGSITGAPKIRAMEIIDELEKTRRDLYTGSIGYISFNGDCDLNIVIRTAIHKEGKYYLGVGGGITCESDLEFEYEETLQKAKALLEAIKE